MFISQTKKNSRKKNTPLFRTCTARSFSAAARAVAATAVESSSSKDYYQAFFWVLIDLIVELLSLIIKPFDNQTER